MNNTSHAWCIKNSVNLHTNKKYLELIILNLTHALELLFQLCLVLAIGNTEVVIRIRALINAVRRGRRSDRHDRSRSLGPLCPSNFLDGHHFWEDFPVAGTFVMVCGIASRDLDLWACNNWMVGCGIYTRDLRKW